MKLKILSAAIIAASLSAPVIADDSVLSQQSEMVQMLLKYDTNADGILTRDEIIAGKTAEFNEADSDADGYLSWTEFNVLMESKQASRITSIFGVMDADANGSVSADEFAAAFADKSASQTATVFALAAGDDSAMSEAELAALFGGEADKQMWMFAGLDDDGDGQLSVDEYTDVPPARPTPSGKSSDGKKGGDRRRR